MFYFDSFIWKKPLKINVKPIKNKKPSHKETKCIENEMLTNRFNYTKLWAKEAISASVTW